MKNKMKSKLITLTLFFIPILIFGQITHPSEITGNSEKQIGYGSVAGEMVDSEMYEEACKAFQTQDSVQFSQMQRDYTSKDREVSNDKAWNYVVEKILFEKEYEALGIEVSQKEFYAYLFGTDGFPVLPEIALGFSDPATGLFNAKLLEERIEELQSSKDENIQKLWEDSKKYYTDRIKQEKYFSLVKQGLYATKIDAAEACSSQNEIKVISYVLRRYAEIDDDEIEISDSELLKYYEEHKNDKKYENEYAKREVRFFDIEINPSKDDSLKFENEIINLKNSFGTAANDSLFVIQNSDVKFYTSSKFATAVPEGHPKAQNLMINYPTYMDTVFKACSIGQIVGPYESKGNVVISKVIGFTPTRLKSRHILLATNQSNDKKVIDQKQKIADSLMKFITKENFEEFVIKYSDDKGSVPTGGMYDNFIEADMVQEFATFCATKPIGYIGTVKTDFGIHIVEVLERDATMYPVLASIHKSLRASQSAADLVEIQANNLRNELDSKISKATDLKAKNELFDTIAERAGYFVRPLSILENAPKIYGFTTEEAEDEILKLAYLGDVKIGDISSPIKDNDRYFIAIVSSIQVKGVPTFLDVENIMKRNLIEEKKAALLTTQMLEDKSLKALAKRTKKEVIKAEISFENPFIAGAGYEPEIVGILFSSMKNGQFTKPLKGKIGVYVVQIEKSIKIDATANNKDEKLADLDIDSQLLAAMKKKAEIIDNRRFLKAGIRR
jgi:peptidyl-prolyl cis-trans isomerase D